MAPGRGRRLARIGFVATCGALVLALLGQAFLAGMAAMTDSAWWEWHKAWVNLWQWLILLLPVLALLTRYPWRWAWLSVLPVPLLYLQYVWAETGRAGSLPYAFGLHAMGALGLFGTSTLLLALALLE